MKRLVLCLVPLVLVAGCGTEPEAVITATAGAAPKEKPPHVVNASPGKPTAPIRLDYELGAKPAVDQPLEIRLSIATALPGELTLALATRAELALAENQEALLDFGTREAGPGPAEELTVTVIPKAEGRSFLLVTATVAQPGNDATRLLAVPVQVGDVPRKLAPSTLLKGDGDEAVISMPADEGA